MWFQSPEFLKWTRLYHLPPENREQILSLLKIEPGYRILDVGCGSGEFTRYIAEAHPDAVFVGVDREPQLIEYARNQNSSNISYEIADALQLPFSDNSFDLVVSHTFFTSVSEPATAMKEMQRVCKTNRKIISITPDSFMRIPHSRGHYVDTPWMAEYRSLKTKLDKLFFEKASGYIFGIVPEEMPYFFCQSGLRSVCVYQISKFFSLSNATLSAERREEYLKLEIAAEKSRMELLEKDEQDRYCQLLERRKDMLLSTENTAWEWSGGSNLLIIGEN